MTNQMKLTISITLLISLALFSCSDEEKGLSFTIENQMTSPITNVKLISNASVDIDSLLISEIVSQETINQESTLDLGGSDGAFILRFTDGNTIREQNFGYYTNGQPTVKLYDISIQDSTILITGDGFPDYY